MTLWLNFHGNREGEERDMTSMQTKHASTLLSQFENEQEDELEGRIGIERRKGRLKGLMGEREGKTHDDHAWRGVMSVNVVFKWYFVCAHLFPFRCVYVCDSFTSLTNLSHNNSPSCLSPFTLFLFHSLFDLSHFWRGGKDRKKTGSSHWSERDRELTIW